MDQKPPAVQVIKVNKDGIRATIYGKKYCWNAKTGEFFIVQNDQWTVAIIPKFHQSVLKERHRDFLYRERCRTFAEQNPTRMAFRKRLGHA